MSYQLHLVVSSDLYNRYVAAAAAYNSTPMAERNSGFDVYNEADTSVDVGACAFIRFGIVSASATCDSGAAAYWLCPRSSISKTRLICANSQGLIDKGYRGPIMGAVRNVGSEVEQVALDGRLFQLVAGDAQPWDKVVIYSTIMDLPNLVTERGAGGFGSTGK